MSKRRRATRRHFLEGEVGDEKSTYQQLNYEVYVTRQCIADTGVRKGDRVTIYMEPHSGTDDTPCWPCAKVGAMHSVACGGFSTEALLGSSRIAPRSTDQRDGAWLRGKVIELEIANAAVERSDTVTVGDLCPAHAVTV